MSTIEGQSHKVPMLDIDALAQQLAVSERFVRRLIEERRIPFHKVGKYVRFEQADVDRWVADRRVEPSD